MWGRLRALPPYFGGKRKLLGRIFKQMPRPSEAPVLVDAFLGGGSVSLFGKARGYRVVANDIAFRSCLVGRALIENDHVTLDPEDLTRLFVEDAGNTGFIEQNFARSVVTTKHARFLDNAFAVARRVEGVKHWLLLLLLTKYVLRMRPMGNFGAKTIIKQAEDEKWEEMNPNYLKDMLSRNVAGHPRAVAETLRKQINAGIFSNGRQNEVHQLDVFKFLDQMDGDILYLDPPYAGTSAYETSLRALDCILSGKMVRDDASAFSKAGAIEVLERLFDASQKFPLWIVSYGNAAIGLETLVELVGRFKEVVHAEEIAYAHLTGLSSEEKRGSNREFLIVGR
ncbi:MAG: DNA adenine methylase [Candidatus Eisenbacteria bacterium]